MIRAQSSIFHHLPFPDAVSQLNRSHGNVDPRAFIIIPDISRGGSRGNLNKPDLRLPTNALTKCLGDWLVPWLGPTLVSAHFRPCRSISKSVSPPHAVPFQSPNSQPQSQATHTLRKRKLFAGEKPIPPRILVTPLLALGKLAISDPLK